MSTGWEEKPFEECIEDVPVTPKILRRDFLESGEFAIVSQEEGLVNGYWNKESDVLRLDRPVVVFGDHTRVLKFVDFDFVRGADGVKVLKPIPAVDTKFFYYQLQTLALGTLGYARHFRLLKEQTIRYPKLAEQRRIVSIIDDAFEGVATAKENEEKNLANARELFKSHLHSIFERRDWKRVRIDDACESIVDCLNRTAPTVDTATPFRMIRTTNVRNGRVNLDTVKCVTEAVYKVWTRRQVPRRGDVLLTREAPMGEVGMITTDEKVFLGQRIVSYRADPDKLNSHFLLYALQSADLQGQIHAMASGSTVQHMRVPDTKNLELPLPNLGEQNAVVATLEALNEETQRLAAIYQRKLDTLDELKKSLLHEAFSGNL